ncbi:MAG: hypothetical protein JXB17_10090 [Bacteroidales bacterium]|nr:hypothetical protein [Bacteroidales bacterium]
MRYICKHTVIILIAFNTMHIGLYGQDVYSPSKIISFTPQYMINRGLKMNIERKLNECKWIQISPELYFANNNNSNGGDHYNELIGAGISVHKKLFFNQNSGLFSPYVTNELGLYLSYGPSYNFFYLNYFSSDDNYGSQYSTYIHKIGGDVLIGYEFIIKNILIIDLYTGLGLRYSFIDVEGEKQNLFYRYYTGFGYTGTLFQGGMRIGLNL